VVPKKRRQLRVWVPVARLTRWPAAVTVEDAFGREHESGAGGPYCFFDGADGRCRLGLGGVVVGTPGGGLYRVRFGDGVEVGARLESEQQWERAA